MRFDDIVENLSKKPKVLIFGALVLLLVALLSGIVLGLGRRSSDAGGETDRSVLAEDGQGNSLSGILMPDPILPLTPSSEGDAIYHFDEMKLQELQLVEPRLSELLTHGRLGLEIDVTPFIYMGEELDILSPEDNLAEP
jgi:hypothetical protein